MRDFVTNLKFREANYDTGDAVFLYLFHLNYISSKNISIVLLTGLL